jgi:hypothetical protein
MEIKVGEGNAYGMHDQNYIHNGKTFEFPIQNQLHPSVETFVYCTMLSLQ